MQTAAKVSLVLTDFSSFKWFADLQRQTSSGEFYQLIASELVKSINTQKVLRNLGEGLVAFAERAYAFRELDILEQTSQALISPSLPRQYEAVGRYYQALCTQRFGRGDVEQAARTFERVAGDAPPTYRARAMQSLGTNSCFRNDYQSALLLYREASRFAQTSNVHDPYATLGAQKMAAVINGLEGNHRESVVLLENLFPLAHAMRWLHPHVYYDYMNSLAVELCEVGRLEEAKNVSQIVLASPFAAAYPEWRETREEIELRGYRASRSAVSLNQAAASAHKTADARNQARQRTIAGNAEAAVNPEVPEVNNLVTLPTARRDSTAAATSAESQPLARVIEFPSRTPSMTEENDKELDAAQKRRFMADRLYEMFMDALDDKEVDVELVEKLYKVYIEKRKKG